MKDVNAVSRPGRFYWYQICRYQVSNFHTNRNCHFRLLLGGFFARTQGPDKILGVFVPKKLCILWRMTQKRIFRKTSLAEYNFTSSTHHPLPLCWGTWNSPKFCGFCLKFWPVMTCNKMHQMCYSFYLIRPKSRFFNSFWVFWFISSYTLWFTTHDFVKWKTLLRYVSGKSHHWAIQEKN